MEWVSKYKLCIVEVISHYLRIIKKEWIVNILVRSDISLSQFTVYTSFNILTCRWLCIVINSYNKTKNDALISKFYFWHKTLHVSDSSSVNHQEFFTVHTVIVYVIQVCWQLASRIRMENCISVLILLASCNCVNCMTYTVAVCRVKNSWWWTEELSETCRVLLVHLVGFVIRILLMCYKSLPGKDPVVSNNVAVWILHKVVLYGFWITPFISLAI